MTEADYNQAEIEFLIQGFKEGFELNYSGPMNRKDRSKNIPFTVGDEKEMWNKIMKEVKEEGYAGPYDEIPFKHYIQSPVGLVPKAGGKTRLIFHLSYNFSSEESGKSVNYFIPKDLCSVKYHNLDDVIKAALIVKDKINNLFGSKANWPVFFSKADGLSAFYQVPLSQKNWPLLILMARDPRDSKLKFFVDKCLPFGTSISCAIYQRISDVIAHLVRHRYIVALGVMNYLDDFLFVEITRAQCNKAIQTFLDVCEEVSLPVSIEKTEWSSPLMVFLGNLLDGKKHDDLYSFRQTAKGSETPE